MTKSELIEKIHKLLFDSLKNNPDDLDQYDIKYNDLGSILETIVYYGDEVIFQITQSKEVF
jgi:hypothetical protein